MEQLKQKPKIVAFDQSAGFFSRQAQKFAEQNRFADALRYSRMAAEKEPDNAQYRLELAQLYTEMCYYEASNEILLYMVQRYGVQMPECFFSVGCNFMGLAEYDRARESLIHYLQVDPYGEYMEDAQEMLEAIDEYQRMIYDEDGEEEDPERRALFYKADKARSLMENGDFRGAIKLFEEILKQDPSLIFVKNNLAFALQSQHEGQRAMQLCREVLEQDPENLHALCNLALFMRDADSQADLTAYTRRIATMPLEENDDILKAGMTLCELGCHKEAQGRLKEMLERRPYEMRVLHALAMTYYNLGDYKAAARLWGEMLRLDAGDTIAAYYRGKAQQALETGRPERKTYPYPYQVPYDEILTRIRTLGEWIWAPKSSRAKERWKEDPDFVNLVLWGLNLGDMTIRRALLGLLGSFGDEKAQSILRGFLLRKSEPDSVKREIFGLLRQAGAKEPYIAYMDGEIVEVHVNLLPPETAELTRSQRVVLEKAMEVAQREGWGEVLEPMAILWCRAVRNLNWTNREGLHAQQWAAALAFEASRQAGMEPVRTRVAKVYHTTPGTLKKYHERLVQALQTKEEGAGEHEGTD